MSDTPASQLDEFGWRPVPRSQSILFKEKRESDPSEPAPVVKVDEIDVPDTKLAKEVQEYARKELREETFNHSMRVYYYGRIILKLHFSSWKISDETYFLCCLLHDIGTTSSNLRSTLMSFEFFGANIAYSLLFSTMNAPKAQAESVTEAIIRHQDLGDTGTITQLGQIIQLATVFDNMGINPELIAKESIESVTKEWPRNGWSGCFASTIREEVGLKPWCHTTVIEGFAEGVEGNELMKPYDG